MLEISTLSLIDTMTMVHIRNYDHIAFSLSIQFTGVLQGWSQNRRFSCDWAMTSVPGGHDHGRSQLSEPVAHVRWVALMAGLAILAKEAGTVFSSGRRCSATRCTDCGSRQLTAHTRL